MKIGYFLSCEEFGPAELLAQARSAEEAGFHGLWISDHFHPWNDEQGHSPFVWSVIGGLSQVTSRMPITTAVTCPTVRIHPAVLAQATATTTAMLPGRFGFGVGSGEALNEQVLGDDWPEADVRLEMLEEAIDLIRRLWEGSDVTHRGRHYTAVNARIYTLPEELPPIVVAAAGRKSTELAGRVGDGLIGTSPDRHQIRRFEEAGGGEKPRYAQVHVCWAETEEAAKRTAHEWWPNTSLPGELGVELPLPRHFEQAAEMLTEDDVASKVTCGPDPERHLDAIREYVDAGFDHVYVHQIGPDQEGFLRFYQDRVLPKL
jgi:G6PDH family F420-dependent oxidoreductase